MVADLSIDPVRVSAVTGRRSFIAVVVSDRRKRLDGLSSVERRPRGIDHPEHLFEYLLRVTEAPR
ncbi:MAG: hypothetical protein QOF60_1057 [Actinomycetota bacterium]|nr:hypothetical protein [Actinomycetota bacterium]